MTELFELAQLQRKNGPPPVVTKTAFAAELGVTAARVSQLVADGLPVTVEGKVPRVEALEWYRNHVTPARRKGLREGIGPDARRELERHRADLAALELAKARGALINRAEAEAAVFARARAERDAHIGFVARVAPLLAAELGVAPGLLFAALDREMRTHLAELAETPLDVLAGGGDE